MNRSNTYKILLIGDVGVGKTSLMKAFTRQMLSIDNDASTIGVDFGCATFAPREILPDYDSEIRIQIWDASGHERFKSLIANYYRQMDCVVIVCDMTNRYSLGSVRRWFNDYSSHAHTDNVFLIANKVDMSRDLVVSIEEIADLAHELCIEFFVTSTKNLYDNALCDVLRSILTVLVKQRGSDACVGTNNAFELERDTTPVRNCCRLM
jgi:small GTP-binding protein